MPPTGSLVRVPFGRGERIGVVLNAPVAAADDAPRLKRITQLIDTIPPLTTAQLRLAAWASTYYQHPLGDVIAASLPGPVRRGIAAAPRAVFQWSLAPRGADALADLQRRAPRQATVLQRVAERACTVDDFAMLDFDWRRALRELEHKGLVDREAVTTTAVEVPRDHAPELNAEQQAAADAVIVAAGKFQVLLLHGVTGSGKTEVYLAAIADTLSRGARALLLVPEISLTQQMVSRLTRRFGRTVAVLHSAMSDTQRADVWMRCRRGEVGVLMGTRSAVWAPLPDVGLVVVDEEHDASLKQHDGFRYHARDVAIIRAQQLGVPIVLGSATPSLESSLNVQRGKYTRLALPQRAGAATPPTIRCVDVRGLKLRGGLSDALCRAIGQRLERGEQSLLFLNRRGFAPVVLCHECGSIAACARCDANYVWHKGRGLLICHHCGGQKRLAQLVACCAAPEQVPLGLGTEQIEESLNELFPGRRIVRVDRDSMRRRGVMEQTFEAVRAGTIDILIGTQMLSKGHDFANVTLVGIVDADSQLFSTDFRAEERLAQTIVQVAGRAGRAAIPGEVLIQTHHPHHELLQILISDGYDRFSERALVERRDAELPPFVPMALIRAEAPSAQAPLNFLRELRERAALPERAGVDILGPIPAAMEKKAGRYRAQLMLTATSRKRLAAGVKALIAASETMPAARSVRWSIDIDPQDTL
jgi:primosomal protein N' (replication factor Y)